MTNKKTHYIPQKIGAAIIAIAMLFVWYHVHWLPVLLLLIGVGVLDIILVIMKVKTISQWIHKLFPQWIDMIIMVVLLIVTWVLMSPTYFMPLLIGVILGHFFWND